MEDSGAYLMEASDRNSCVTLNTDTPSFVYLGEMTASTVTLTLSDEAIDETITTYSKGGYLSACSCNHYRKAGVEVEALIPTLPLICCV